MDVNIVKIHKMFFIPSVPVYILKADDFSIFLNSSLRLWEFPRRATLENLIFSPNKQIAQGTHMSISWVAELEKGLTLCAGGRYIPTLHNPALVSPPCAPPPILITICAFIKSLHGESSVKIQGILQLETNTNDLKMLKLKFISPVLQFPKNKGFYHLVLFLIRI